MPATLSYPGVYIEEIPSGVRTIMGVATSIAAFVGRAKRGPVDEPIVINGFGDFERIFGGLWEYGTLGFAVRDFFLNGGGQAIVVRIYSPTFKNEQERQQVAATATTDAQAAADKVAKAVTDAVAANNAVPVADLKTAVNTAAADVDGAQGSTVAAKSAAHAVAKKVAEAVDAQNPAPTPATVSAEATGAVAGAVKAAVTEAAPVTKAPLSVNGLDLEAAYEGTWGNQLRARIDTDVSDTAATNLGVAKAALFNLSVRDMKGDVTEVFRNLTVVPSARQVKSVLSSESKLVRVRTDPAAMPTAHDPASGADVWDASKFPTNPAKTYSTGVTSPVSDDGKALTATDFIDRGDKKGLYALNKADIFNLLCIPPLSWDSDVDPGLIDKAVDFCVARRAMFLIDPPASWTDKDAAKNGIAAGVGSVSSNAAIFFPRVYEPNTLHENQLEPFVPCGAVAGIFARTDTARGVWKAPAGLDATLIGVPKLTVSLTDMENGELNQLGINCLRTMPAAGRLVWGARTRAGDDRLASEWKYIPVRRTALYIEESLYRGTQWVVFEPNDEPLWASIRLNVGAFMHGLFRQGAFQGKSPREAYFVKCDAETTTQDDINRGVVNIVVGFAPLKPAEFVVIKLQQMAGQIQT